jgi:hypothetical protein
VLGRVASHSARDDGPVPSGCGGPAGSGAGVRGPAIGAEGASRLASGMGLGPWSRSARVNGRGAWRRSESGMEGLESRCSNGTFAVLAEDEDGSDRRSSNEGELFAFPFPLSQYSVLEREAAPFPLSRIDLGSVGGGHAFARGGTIANTGLSEGGAALLGIDEVPAPQSSLG